MYIVFLLGKPDVCYSTKSEAYVFGNLNTLFNKKNILVTETMSCVNIRELQRMKPLKGIEYRGVLMKNGAQLFNHFNIGMDVSQYIQLNHANSEKYLRELLFLSQQYSSLPIKLDTLHVTIKDKRPLADIFDLHDSESKSPRIFKRIKERVSRLLCFCKTT